MLTPEGGNTQWCSRPPDPSASRAYSTSQCRSPCARCPKEYFDASALFHCLWCGILQHGGLLAIGQTSSAALLKRWATLGWWPGEGDLGVTWDAVHHLIRPAISYAAAQARQLQALVRRSEEMLHPLEEPLKMPFSLHRWLATDREEAYSDWLVWILEQLGPARRVGYVLSREQMPGTFTLRPAVLS